MCFFLGSYSDTDYPATTETLFKNITLILLSHLKVSNNSLISSINSIQNVGNKVFCEGDDM